MARTGRPKAELLLSTVEREALVSWSRRRTTAQALAFQARIVLSCAEGASNQDVAAALGTRPQTVAKWRGRFVRDRLQGLSDEPRPGAPRKVTDEQVEKVIVKTLEEKPVTGDTHWSTRGMARATGMSQPRFPGSGGRSASSRTWWTPVATGKIIGQHQRRHRHQEFLRFLKTIDKNTPAELDLHLICDNYATHKTPEIKQWLATHPRFHLHFTPTSGSWLNLVERWFGELTTRKLRRSTHHSVNELEADVQAWIEAWNNDPQPFVWTKTADEILDSLASYCTQIHTTRTSNSGH